MDDVFGKEVVVFVAAEGGLATEDEVTFLLHSHHDEFVPEMFLLEGVGQLGEPHAEKEGLVGTVVILPE